MSKVKASQFIAWLKKQVGNGYVYGTVNVKCTIDLLKQKDKEYGPKGTISPSMAEGYYSKGGDYTKGSCARWLNKIVADCSGLIKAGRKALSGIWADVSAQGTYDQCTKRGPINNMPLIPGCTVYMHNKTKGRMGHVGTYIGNGQVVEARGVAYGVVTTKLADRAWTHWGLLDWLDHDLKADTGKVIVGTQADAGDATNAKPDDIAPGTTVTLFDQALDILAQTAGISTEYWKIRKDIDPCFALLCIKIANAIK